MLASALLVPSVGHSVALLDGMGGAAGYGNLAMSGNDDGSSNLLALPFEINFFGTTYNDFFINNNGNITFNSRVSSFTPRPFPISSQPMIAPYWADVDTRCTACGEVYIGSPNADTTVVTWNNVGYYSNNSSPTNNFQLVLRNQGSGDFDIEFRYDRLAWTTGDASGGTGGLGGTPAQAGFDAGDGTNFFALPGSFTSNVLNLANTTNVAGGEDGLWSFAIRSGATPGETPDNPIQPVVNDEGFDFEFGVVLNEQIFIDPPVAVGYDYIITDTASPLFTSVQLPTGIGDNLYDLYLWDGTDWVLDTANLSGGVQHNFTSPLDRFRIMGIEESELLDPTDPLAFVTGLTFNGTGVVSMSQNPVIVNVPDPNPAPEPAILLLFGSGMFGLMLFRRKRFVA